MLTALHIQGLAIIESLTIDFTKGFNVITGETGAGKSILIKALNLVLGSKSGSDTVRQGFDCGSVSANFEISKNHKVCQLLKDYGLGRSDQEKFVEVILRRQITSKGKSSCWVNDLPVTLSTLKDIGTALIDVFSQHQHYSLLESQVQLYYLDQFIQNKVLLEQVSNAYRACFTLINETAGMIEQLKRKRQDSDYLLFRFEELKQFSPHQNDYNELLSLCSKAERFHKLNSVLSDALNWLETGFSGEALSTPLWTISKLIAEKIPGDAKIHELSELAAQLGAKIDDLDYQLRKISSALDFNESSVDRAQQRLAKYQEFFRKLSINNVEELVQKLESFKQELELIENGHEQIRVKINEAKELAKAVSEQVKLLSIERQHATQIVKNKIEKELKDLSMAGAKIKVELSPFRKPVPDIEVGSVLEGEARKAWSDVVQILSECSEKGAERAEFFLSANPGEPLLPLTKVASGGEISRIMLALKKALSAGADSCVLVFDEIDTGISGKVADVVGKKMKELGKQFQVICISHLPQVAAYADTHFLAAKYQKNHRTESKIFKLAGDDSAKEIARLLSGPEITSPSLANAKELIERARESSS